LRRSSDTMARTTRLPGDPVLEQRGSGQSGDGHRHHRRPRVVTARGASLVGTTAPCLPPPLRYGGRDLPPSPPAQGDKATAAGTFPLRLRLRGTRADPCGTSGRAPSPPSAVLPRSTAVPRGRSPVYVRVPSSYGRIRRRRHDPALCRAGTGGEGPPAS